MANQIRVSCNAMKQDAEALGEALKSLPVAVEGMQVALKNLARCWNGPAWETYQNQVNEDIQNMNEIYQILVEIQKDLGNGRDNYLKTEYDVYSEIKSIWI